MEIEVVGLEMEGPCHARKRIVVLVVGVGYGSIL